ncbi:MAG: SDR family NAD(P)-dependent oxidoreductase [Cenarchaeum sp. SB0665_bin_23]|nr:SDR family NAD(P)-dependent oxidoreductase [Cenarchaeum sp. SB0664_bin_35]MXY61261.1 SDR family NAD(P)-dependent oxidoreductase [Cenarchaeum sp. SB0665_bin_23]MYB47640.1 SDR family NAD(P)-dependent oxidoreductase [Cenarchaeum sp. SB0662_bin_33]MYG32794.1 SDR family NAD(P)-dependent oxidoreductase [Cenarchaeum sp. SB0677_bin_16]MYJ27856.1 SDR family NAD(P)-dependent oxidoreductase [Cenarchaeum sp. SB0672_bin_9]
MVKFAQKTALVTGSGTGIGKVIAIAFVEQGASVIILGRRKEPLVEAASELQEIIDRNQSGASVRIFPGVDVSSESSISKMYSTLKNDGVTIDYIVNNAGVSGPVTCFPNANMDDFVGTVAIHLTGTFWGSVCGLQCMRSGGKIITISTFFTEERPLEQRPYRFRGPYTASQGAKNRLAEAMSWELVDEGIISIATNPGPVHSDRIYKTVYPKAAAEFMRVGGFEGLTPQQVEEANSHILPLLGEDESVIKSGIDSAAGTLNVDADILDRLLQKIQSIAEKVQKNTSHMIADRQFLSQRQVAETVLNLCDDTIGKIVNGKVIPGDRVFYPVRPHVGNRVPPVAVNYSNGCVVMVVDPTGEADAQRVSTLAQHITESGGNVVLLLPESTPEPISEALSKYHSHRTDLDDVTQLRRWFGTAAQKMGKVHAIIHLTGDMPDVDKITQMKRVEWDGLVDKFINRPAKTAQEALEYFVPGGGADPRKFVGADGSVLIVGPELPRGRKVSGAQRAKVEIFRGGLRPFTTTINQELSDVLKSNVRVFTVLPGTTSGSEPDHAKIVRALDYSVSDDAHHSGEVIFNVDESR